ncbi:MAG: outer membrane protein [Chakrabartia sp.]
MNKALIVGLSTMAFIAGTSAAQAEAFNGGHVGVSINMDNYEVKAQDLFYDGTRFDGLSGNGVGFGAYAGYDVGMGDGAFAGIEAFGDFGSAKAMASDGEGGEASVKAKNGFGVTARLGGKISEATGAYVRAGWTQIHVKGVLGDYSESYNESGLLYGVGLETALGKSASLRAEYLISDFGTVGEADSGLKAKNGQFRLGLGFNF